MRPHDLRARGFILTLLGVSCATPLSASHTAKVVPMGHVEVTGAWGQNYPVGAFLRLDPGVNQTAKGFVNDLKSPQHTIAIDPTADLYAGIAAGLSLADLPATQWEIGVRAGIAPRVDLGVRYTGSAIRGEVFGQVYDSPGFRVAAGVGCTWRGFNDGITGLVAQLGLLSFSELDADAAVLGGWDWKYGSLYFGPKVVYSKYWVTGALTGSNSVNINVLGAQISSSFPLGLNLSQSWLPGAVIGGRAGYKYVYVMAELATYDAIYAPSLFGLKANLGGAVLYPTAGIVATF